MSREVRRVPLDFEHPTKPNEWYDLQRSSRQYRGDPEPKLTPPGMKFDPLWGGFAESLARWEEEHESLDSMEGETWDFRRKWHLGGFEDCRCHPGVAHHRHPVHVWNAAGTESVEITARDEAHLRELMLVDHEDERPDPIDYLPVWDFGTTLGYCLYETVSEGTPVTPVFATEDELIEHLATVGQDYDSHPMRREAAESLVRMGCSFGSGIIVGGQILNGADDHDRISQLLPRVES